MQPSLTLVTAATPLAALFLWSALPGQADYRHLEISQLPPLPELSSAPALEPVPLWIKASRRVSLASLANLLDLTVEELAASNKTNQGRVFKRGDWIRFDVSAEQKQTLLAFEGLDVASLSDLAPSLDPAPSKDKAQFQQQDTLHTFLRRHGLTSSQLRAFNPGLDLASMTAGREVRISQAATGQKLLAIRPSVSGGASWPSMPSAAYGQPTRSGD